VNYKFDYTTKKDISMKYRILPALLSYLFVCSCESTKPEQHELVGKWDANTQTSYWSSFSQPDSTDTTIFSYPWSLLRWKFDTDNTGFYEYEYTENGAWHFEGWEITWTADNDHFDVTFTKSEEVRSFTYEVNNDKLTTTEEIASAEGKGDWVVTVFSRM